jgi:predicted SnoaL-like aldol condensation-catalyzing enzyme
MHPDTEQNKKSILDFYTLLYNEKKYTQAEELLSDQVFNHHPGAVWQTRQHLVDAFRNDVSTKFPNVHIEVSRVVAEGDFVWTQGLITGLPNNGQILSVDIWKLADGKISEHWDVQQPVKVGQNARDLL